MLYLLYIYDTIEAEVYSMKLFYNKNAKDPTYYAQQGIRNGKKTTTRNVKNFGKHSDLLKITDDPLAYVKDEIRKMNEEFRVGRIEYDFKVDFNEHVEHTDDEASASKDLNIGYFYLQEIMQHLKPKDFFSNITVGRKMKFDCYMILRFLTYARILDPGSKYSTWEHLENYYEKPGFDYQHILRCMDVLYDHYEDYLKWSYEKSNSVVKRDTSVLYYDCTNFYFECEKEDDVVIDEITGETMCGLRKYGVSKEHRPNPIVEMGLFMDKNGIPVSMCLHPGNTNEQLTAIPLEKELLKMTDGARFIYCADAGLGSYNIRKFNSMGGRAFIVTQSIKKLSDTLKTAVFNDCGYKLLSDNKTISTEYLKNMDKADEKNLSLYKDMAYKVINADKAMDLGLYEEKVLNSGKVKKTKATGMLRQKVIITFSRKMMEYQRTIRNRQIERARKLVARNDPEELKKGPNDVRRFMKRTAKTKSGEKAVIEYIIDEEKIKEEEKYDGYYAVATNLDDPVKDILEVTHNRYKIEDCFRIMKTNFSGRPAFHWTEPRIKAHFLICYTALLVYRLLEYKLNEQGTHITTANLIRTLQNMNVVNIHDIEYMALYKGSKTLDALTKLSKLELDHVHYRPKDLNGKIKKIL